VCPCAQVLSVAGFRDIPALNQGREELPANSETGRRENCPPTVKREWRRPTGGRRSPTVKREKEEKREQLPNSETGTGEGTLCATGITHGRGTLCATGNNPP